MLRAQLGLGFAKGVGTYGYQVALLGIDVLRRGVVPLVLLALFYIYAVQVFLQVLQVAHHQNIAFLSGYFDSIVGIKPEIRFGRSEVSFPVVVADVSYTVFKVVLFVHAEHVGVGGVPPQACHHGHGEYT